MENIKRKKYPSSKFGGGWGGGGVCKTYFKNCVPQLTRTAWAVFKYCGTKTATLSLSIRY